MHIFVTQLCIMGYLPNALWDLWDGSIKNNSQIYASVNQHGVPQYYTYLSQRLQIFCQVYIYIFKNQNQSKIQAWYVFN